MRRTTIYLPVALHDDLRQLAFERRCSMADLLRLAVESQFQAELAEVRADPFREERLKNIGTGRRLRQRRALEARLRSLG